MAQAKRDSLEARSNRLKLAARKEPYWSKLGEGQFLGYYRPGSKAAGSWVAKWRDIETGTRKKSTLGTADDYADANGEQVLTWAQASGKARSWFEVADHDAVLVAGGEVLPKGPYTVAQAMEDYLQDAERRGVRGVPQARSASNARIIPDLGQIEVAKLTRTKIEAWLRKLAESAPLVRRAAPSDKAAPTPRNFKIPREPKSVKVVQSPTPPRTANEKRARKDSANRVLTNLKAALNHALAYRRVSCAGDAWREVKPYAGVGEARVRFLEVADQVRLVNACPPNFRRLVQGALFTGGRYGELARALVKDFNSSAGTLFLQGKGKGEGKPRHVVLTEEGQDFFLEMTVGRAAGELIFQHEVTRKKRGESGSAWAQSDQFRPMSKACEDAGLESLTFYELRHSYCSMMLNRGCPMVYLAAQLGQAGTRMIEKHYGHIAQSAMADAIRKLAPVQGIHQPEGKVAALRISGGAE
jgi:integrase